MECKDIREKLSPHLEGILSSEEKRLVEAHLISCQQCSSAVEDLKKTGEFLKNLDEVEPPAWMTKRIMARVTAEREKKGIFQKLFYPLHIKVPIEALATVLIAVVAVYVFRAVEPEMKSLPAPPAVGPLATKDEPSKPSRAPAADALAPRVKEAIKEQRRSDKDTVAPSPTASAFQARQEEESSGPAEQPLTAKKKEKAAESQGELGRAAEPLNKQQPSVPKAAPQSALQPRESLVLSDTSRHTQERQKMAAAPKAMATADMKPEPVQVLVTVKDVSAASGEVETLLDQAGARNIKKESREGREVLTAELKAERVKEFLGKLKAVGEVKEKMSSPDTLEGNIPMRVEIFSNP